MNNLKINISGIFFFKKKIYHLYFFKFFCQKKLFLNLELNKFFISINI